MRKSIMIENTYKCYVKIDVSKAMLSPHFVPGEGTILSGASEEEQALLKILPFLRASMLSLDAKKDQKELLNLDLITTEA
jgi:hypothetical protein